MTISAIGVVACDPREPNWCTMSDEERANEVEEGEDLEEGEISDDDEDSTPHTSAPPRQPSAGLPCQSRIFGIRCGRGSKK